MDAFQRVKGMKMPPAGPAAGIAKVLLAGGAAAYAFNNALFNVEGGHRAVVFNRLVGIKDTVRAKGTRAAGTRAAGTTRKKTEQNARTWNCD